MKELTINIAGQNVEDIILALSELHIFLNDDQLRLPYRQDLIMSCCDVSIDFIDKGDYLMDQVNF